MLVGNIWMSFVGKKLLKFCDRSFFQHRNSISVLFMRRHAKGSLGAVHLCFPTCVLERDQVGRDIISSSDIRRKWDAALHISLPLHADCCITERRWKKARWERYREGHGRSQSTRLNYLIMSHYWALINPHPSPHITARTRRGRELFLPYSSFLDPSFFLPAITLSFHFLVLAVSFHSSSPAYVHLICHYVIFRSTPAEKRK